MTPRVEKEMGRFCLFKIKPNVKLFFKQVKKDAKSEQKGMRKSEQKVVTIQSTSLPFNVKQAKGEKKCLVCCDDKNVIFYCGCLDQSNSQLYFTAGILLFKGFY